VGRGGNGDARCDVNRDGGITGDDVETFIGLWEARSPIPVDGLSSRAGAGGGSGPPSGEPDGTPEDQWKDGDPNSPKEQMLPAPLAKILKDLIRAGEMARKLSLGTQNDSQLRSMRVQWDRRWTEIWRWISLHEPWRIPHGMSRAQFIRTRPTIPIPPPAGHRCGFTRGSIPSRSVTLLRALDALRGVDALRDSAAEKGVQS